MAKAKRYRIELNGIDLTGAIKRVLDEMGQDLLNEIRDTTPEVYRCRCSLERGHSHTGPTAAARLFPDTRELGAADCQPRDN
jgi:hypothetical protein